MSQIDPQDPILKTIHRDRLINRDIDQLLGICEFALQDGCIDQSEAESIYSWLQTRRESINVWPVSVLYDRLSAMLFDGRLDNDEQLELLDLVTKMTRPPGEESSPASPLPLNAPPPEVVVNGSSFCFTGVFDYGRRAECESAVIKRGGIPISGVTKKLDYLVIGNIGSEVWRHSSFGSKIAKAVDYREAGARISIINEMHWRQFIE